MASGINTLINVSNLDKSIEFYKGLGLRAKKGGEGEMIWGVVSSGESELILYPKAQEPDRAQPGDTKAWLSGELGKGVVLLVGVGDARKNWEKAQAARADVDEPLHDNQWGGRSFRVNDPDGYLVAVVDQFPGA